MYLHKELLKELPLLQALSIFSLKAKGVGYFPAMNFAASSKELVGVVVFVITLIAKKELQ